MFKIKNLIAGCLAAVMLLTMSVTAFAADDVADGTYTVEFSYMKDGDLESASTMATYIFTTVAATVEDGSYALTFDYLNYFNGFGITCGAFSQIQQKVGEEWVDLTIVDVSAEYDDGYDYGRFTATVDSLENITLNAYVDVMEQMSSPNPWSSFVAVPDASTWTLVSLADSNTDSTTESMTISASVAKNVATSTVVIPESTDMGELSKIDDTVVSYGVEIDAGYGQTVTVTVDDELILTAGDASLTVANDFDGENGTLTVSAEDVAKIASYESDLSFTGALSFSIVVG